MSTNAFILFVGFFLYVSSPPRGIYAQPTKSDIPKNPVASVLDVIVNDAGLCAAGKPFSASSYAKVCKNVEYPSGNVTLKSTNSEQFMCLGFYDRIYRLCHLDTLRESKQTVLPDNGAKFDEQVKKSLPVNGEAILQFCEAWRNVYPPKYEKTLPFVTQFENAIKKPALCVKHCTADDASIVPLCIVLATMDNMSNLTANGVDNIEETSSKKVASAEEATQQQETTVVQNSKVDVTSGPVQPVGPKVETNVEAAQPNKLEETQKTIQSADKSTDTLQNQPEVSRTDLNSDKPQQQTSHILPPTEAKKVDPEAKQTSANAVAKVNVDVPASNPGDDAQKAKGKTPEKQIEEKADKNINSDTVNVAEAPAALPPSADAAAPLQNEGISGEDISEVGGGGNEDTKLGVISQHTQDDPEDRFGDADGMDVAEPPASLEEDPDQTGNLPSEKKEYIPHLPSPNVDDSHFFGYFTVIGVICIAGYVGYHNKQKILAMVLEGRRSRGGRSRRRPSTANYRKLDCTLEEAVTSQCNSNVTHVIY